MLQNSKVFFAIISCLAMSVNSFGMRHQSRVMNRQNGWSSSIDRLNTDTRPNNPIREISDETSLNIFLNANVNQTSLVIFDCDEVLLAPKYGVFLAENMPHLNNHLNSLSKSMENKDVFSTGLNYLNKQAPLSVCFNESLPKMVKYIQEEVEAQTMVLTSCGFGAANNGKGTIEDNRIKDLHDFGFNFENSWPASMNGKITFRSDYITSDILFKDGILFIKGISKGDALKIFFDKNGFTSDSFSKVILIDDSYNNHVSVLSYCTENNIPFAGAHFTKKNALIKSKEIVENEINSFFDQVAESIKF